MEVIGSRKVMSICSLAGRIDTNLCGEVEFENIWIFSIVYALYPYLANNQLKGRQGQSYESKPFGWKTYYIE